MRLNYFLRTNEKTLPIFLDASRKKVNGKILMIMPAWHNFWELPGGAINIGEGIPRGVARECFEETGYKIKATSSTPLTLSETDFYHRSIKKFYRSINMVFLAKLISKKQNSRIINSDRPENNEAEKIAWLPLAKLNKKNCHPNIYPAIKIIKNKSI